MRSSGILLHISSLPTDFGIGTLGKEAREFVEFLVRAGQRYWQVLPLGPTGYGDSPYQALSTFAGNPYFIDLQTLCDQGLLKKKEVSRIDWGRDKTRVDYGILYQSRLHVLYIAYERGWAPESESYRRFVEENQGWLPDYALFMALKEHFQQLPWYQWPAEDIRLRRPLALEVYRERLRDRVQFWSYLQFLFDQQWADLRAYTASRGVEILGDIPFYVAMDSADVWAHPELFLLDERHHPTQVAGCPPDAFSDDGQLWGNPLYDWEYHKYTGYQWWTERVEAALRRHDLLRLDHFRGFASYYAIPSGETTARNGRWMPGPGGEFFSVLRERLGALPFLAEDLGEYSPQVGELLQETGLPGMKVLQFAFAADGTSTHLPHTYDRNCAVYTGTHDNDTIRSWLRSLSKEDARFCWDYLDIHLPREVCWAMLHTAWQSVADTAIAPMQDFLELGGSARMNTPATTGGNWQWRMRKGAHNDRLANRVRRMTQVYGRLR